MELGSASSSSSASGGSDSLNGLKFGKKIYFEDVGVGVQDKFGGGPPSLPPIAAGLPPPSPAKKGRIGVGQSGQPSRCQVEGCNVDLSDAKAYYSRHKVCGMHSKFPRVTVAGLEQRFCQQCSRST
ncbi:squamosa promoter-binding 9 [Olea europaea subsp. europaea]|uniref:Squamosa promoter-binding 9 n=1 Tax=Olea europaea subsp. europaea TaxID=158383 RepID=A0A8S0PDH1_OLEEU|nr:squamosa promoter-binding 9 [Olea europaea subsp. europaea]